MDFGLVLAGPVKSTFASHSARSVDESGLAELAPPDETYLIFGDQLNESCDTDSRQSVMKSMTSPRLTCSFSTGVALLLLKAVHSPATPLVLETTRARTPSPLSSG